MCQKTHKKQQPILAAASVTPDSDNISTEDTTFKIISVAAYWGHFGNNERQKSSIHNTNNV